MKNSALVSVVINSTGEEKQNTQDMISVVNYLSEVFTDFELILMLQPYEDIDSYKEVLLKLSCVRIVKLGNNCSEDVMSGAALEASIGDYVVLFCPTYHSLDSIQKSVEMCRTIGDYVVGIGGVKVSIRYRLLSKLFNIGSSILGYKHIRNDLGFRCLSRECVNRVTRSPNYTNSLQVKIHRTGMKAVVMEAAGTKSMRKSVVSSLLKVFRETTYNSTQPLKWISGVGLLGSILASFISLYSVLVAIFSDSVVEGWATTILFLSTLFTIQFLILIFITEYLSRLLHQGMQKDSLVVSEEINSSVMIDANRENVIDRNEESAHV